MSERDRNRSAVERVAQRIKEHSDRQGGAMRSASEARKQAAEVARKSDAERAAGAQNNPNKGRAAAARAEKAAEARERAAGPKPGRVFVDLKKG